MKKREVIELSDDDDIQFIGHLHHPAVLEVPRPSSSLTRIHEQIAAHFNDNRVSIIIALLCLYPIHLKAKETETGCCVNLEGYPATQAAAHDAH